MSANLIRTVDAEHTIKINGQTVYLDCAYVGALVEVRSAPADQSSGSWQYRVVDKRSQSIFASPDHVRSLHRIDHAESTGKHLGSAKTSSIPLSQGERPDQDEALEWQTGHSVRIDAIGQDLWPQTTSQAPFEPSASDAHSVDIHKSGLDQS